jgi:hypothetical protein
MENRFRMAAALVRSHRSLILMTGIFPVIGRILMMTRTFNHPGILGLDRDGLGHEGKQQCKSHKL